jgi:Lrp/AsnC family transcriptional regulator, leucine-responsive regulatory protein
MNRLWFENGGLDQIDAELLATLATDGRITIADLARKVGMSAPSVAERIKRLEEAQVILGYSARINPAALGLPLAVHIRVRPMPGQLGKLAALLNKLPAIVECDRITGDDCFVARAHVASVQELEKLIDQIIPLGTTNTAIIQSSPVERRLPPIPRVT